MDKDIQEFLAKSLKALQKQIGSLEKGIEKLERRIRMLEPDEPDEMLIKTADGKLGLYLVRDEEGNYVAPSTDRTEL